jgi:hypothetical protein
MPPICIFRFGFVERTNEDVIKLQIEMVHFEFGYGRDYKGKTHTDRGGKEGRRIRLPVQTFIVLRIMEKMLQ